MSLRNRLGSTRGAFATRLAAVRGRDEVDVATWERLEEALILADVGVVPSEALLALVRERAAVEGASGGDGVVGILKEEIVGRLDGADAEGVAAALVTKLYEANLGPEWSADIQHTIWVKILLNVAINPVCAIAGVRNGALLEVPELWEQAHSAMLEAAMVAEASGADLSELDLEGTLRKVAGATAQNRCSMLQDVMAGRQTEIDELCGAMVSRGKSLGVATPRNEMLHALVRGIHISSSLE